MRTLIGNEINTKSIIFNILNHSCPNIILLHGEYGTGKTEFAKDIAKLITCMNPSRDGYCNTCSACKEADNITENTFLKNISITNMTMVDTNKVIELIRENIHLKHSGNKVYIYDEFQAVDLNLQEMWLSETSKLMDTYLILTTTNLRKIDKGISSRSVKMKMNSVNLSNIKSILKMYNLDDIEAQLIPILYNAFHGVPRDIILTARFCKNSGLTLEEKIEFIQHYKHINIKDLFLLIKNQEEYFRYLNQLQKEYTIEEISKSVINSIWDYLSMSDIDYNALELSQNISKQHLIYLLIDLKDKPEIAFINLYASINYNLKGKNKKVIESNIQSLDKVKEVSKGVIEKW